MLGAVVVATMVGAGCGSGSKKEASAAPTPPHAAPRANAPATPAPPPRQRLYGLDRFGQVTDPLPAPLPMPAGSPDAAAKVLAQRVLDGGADALAALVTALQASGIAIRGPEGQLAVRPAEPWAGQIVESWEVRTLLATVLPERTVSFALSDLAEVVRAPVPELTNAPVAPLLVHDLRALAHAPASPSRFWARFVIELGRSPEGRPSPLVTQTDLAKIRLNGLQVSLILRRLSSDFLKRSRDPGQKSAANTSSHGWSFVVPLYADTLPCTLDDKTRTIMDLTAAVAGWGVGGFDGIEGSFTFGGVLGTMENAGWNGAKQYKAASGYANIFLAYAKLFVTYAALEVKVTMDGEPLVRTKDVRPASGERKQLTAVVRLNIGNASMLNCFRIMLNAAGLDFSLPNDGVVKGAQVDWEGLDGFDEAAAALHDGPDQIVRFVGDQGSQYQTGGAFTSFNSITKSVTDADGKVRVTVEGVGQKTKLAADVHKRTKQASVRLNVALQGADLLGDLKDAAINSAAGVKVLATAPVDMLSRARWASAGHFTFDVTDWSDEGKWSGTVTVATMRSTTTKSEGAKSRGTSQETETLDASLQVTDTLQDVSNGGNIVGNMKASAEAHYTIEGESSSTSIGAGCNGQDLAFSGHKWAEGSYGGGDVQIFVVIQGTEVHMGVNSSGFQIPYSGSQDSDEQRNRIESKMTFNGVKSNCTIDTFSRSTPVGGTAGIGTIDVAGQVDPKDPDHVHGSVTKHFGTDTTQTITWDLKRS